MKKPYNTTQLHPELEITKHVFHRDQFAHLLRWSHVLKIAPKNAKILDFGCGSGNLYELLWRNKYKPAKYLGLDIRSRTIKINQEKYPEAKFEVADLTSPDLNHGTDWDMITSFEVAEHIGKQNISKFLDNIAKHCNESTIVLLSTPCFDEKVGAAENHIYDSGDGRGKAPQEFTFEELKTHILDKFEIESIYGTFASIKDYKHLLNDWQQEMFNHLSGYYDVNLLSNMMAPFFPEQSRNCLWRLKKRSL